MMKILCGTDFSPHAESSCMIAARLAKKLGDELVLVHAFEPITTMAADYQAELASVEKKWRQGAQAQLANSAGTLRATGVSVKESLVDHFADQALLKSIDSETRMIVVGTHGKRGVTHAMLGSVAERLLRTATVPVLVLHKENTTLIDWIENERPMRMYMAVDSSAASDAPLNWLRTFRSQHPCDVTLVHYYWPPQEHLRLGIASDAERSRRTFAETTVTRVLQRELQDYIGALPGKGSVSLLVQPTWGKTGDQLAELADHSQADMMLVGAHTEGAWKRVLQSSVSRDLVQSAHIPVLCVPQTSALEVRPAKVPSLARVVVATDFSPVGDRAVAYAYSLLGLNPGHVDIVHVGKTADAEKKMTALIPPEAETYGIQTKVWVLDSAAPSTAIAQHAARTGADAICIGSHGNSGLKKALLGSVAQALLNVADRPVFVVPQRRD